MRSVALPDGPWLSTAHPEPEPDPELLTESRGEDVLRVGALCLNGSSPSPEPDREDVSKSRGENAYGIPLNAGTSPTPEQDEESITHSRGEAVTLAALPGGGGDEEQRETAVRGEDVGGEETRTRGESPESVGYGVTAETGTFTRGESDLDEPYFVASTSKTSTRGEDPDFDSGRYAGARFDSALDDPAEVRRITVLGVLAARQKASSDGPLAR